MSVEICAPAVIAIALARLLHEIVLDNGTAAKRSSNSIVLRRERAEITNREEEGK